MNATTLEIQEEISKASPVERRWLRVSDAVLFSGMCRSKIYSLIRNGLVRSACLRDCDRVRGTRLINAESLHNYIVAHEGVWSDQVPDKKTASNGGEQHSLGKLP
jgi:hypothetical protein